MNGNELRCILRHNNIRNSDFCEKMNIGSTSLSKILTATQEDYALKKDEGTGEVPFKALTALTELLGVDMTDPEKVSDILAKIPEDFKQRVLQDNRRFVDRRDVYYRGGYY